MYFEVVEPNLDGMYVCTPSQHFRELQLYLHSALLVSHLFVRGVVFDRNEEFLRLLLLIIYILLLLLLFLELSFSVVL